MVLKPLADLDNSGFISTSEETEFRALAEFGYKAAHVISAEEGDIDRIHRGLAMDEASFADMLEKYMYFIFRASELRIESFPTMEDTSK